MEGQGPPQVVELLGAQQGDLGGCHAQAFGAGRCDGGVSQDAVQFGVADLDGDDAVVRQQTLVDRFGEGDAVDDGAVEAVVVHGGHFAADRNV